jgi:hypothetical protein
MRRSRHSPYNTHDNLHFCINDVITLTEALSPASHQLWLHGVKGLCISQTQIYEKANVYGLKTVILGRDGK